MRSIIPIGMLETSVKLLRPWKGIGKSAMRRPLTSTRVWLGPRPRRSTCCAPGEKSAPLEDCWLWVSPPFWVIERSTSGTLVKPLAWICSAVMTVTGAGPSTCARGMREPVTCTVSSCCTPGAGVWAPAVAATPINASWIDHAIACLRMRILEKKVSASREACPPFTFREWTARI